MESRHREDEGFGQQHLHQTSREGIQQFLSPARRQTLRANRQSIKGKRRAVRLPGPHLVAKQRADIYCRRTHAGHSRSKHAKYLQAVGATVISKIIVCGLYISIRIETLQLPIFPNAWTSRTNLGCSRYPRINLPYHDFY